jgi:CBS domain-containing protein
VKTAAKDIMNFDLTSVLEDDLVQDAIHVLYSHNLQGIPVLDEDWNLVGFLSESDVLKAAVPTYLEVLARSSFLEDEEDLLLSRFRSFGNKKVGDFMNRNPIFVEPETSLMAVADLMIRKSVKRLPVVEHGKLAGMISREAFCEFLMDESVSRGAEQG